MAKAPKATKATGRAAGRAAAAGLLGLMGGTNPFANLPGQVRLNEQTMRPTPMIVPKTTRKGKGK